MQVNSNTASASAGHSYTMNTGGINQDEQIKSIQDQIETVKQQLQSLTGNKDMSPEMIMEQRMKLQQQIQDLNKQLSQRKIEIQNEKREEVIVQPNNKVESDTKDSNETSMSTKTMGGLISASNNLHLADTPMKVYKEAQNRGDTATMERALGYAAEFIQKAKDSTESAAKTEENSKSVKKSGNLEGEQALEYRKKDGIKQESRIASVQTDTVEIGQEGRAALEYNTNYNVYTPEANTKTGEKPIIYTKSGEASQPEPKGTLSLQV